MVCKLIFVWGLAWTPYAIMALWAMFFQAHNMAPLMGVIPLLFCKCSAVANVMLYGIRYSDKLFTLLKSVTVFLSNASKQCISSCTIKFSRVPKIGSEVKKVLQIALPFVLVDMMIPNELDNSIVVPSFSKEYPQNVIRKSSSGNKGSSNNTPNLENSLSRKIREIRRETPTISRHIESESCPAATIKKYLSVRFNSSSDTDKSITYSIENAAVEYSKCQGEKMFQKTPPHSADDTSTKEPPTVEVVIQVS